MANIELDGANKTVKVDSGNLTLDIPGDIILDADGANVTFKDGGTSVLDLSNSSTDAVLTVSTQDKDLIIKGDDGGSAITAATFDMSDAGTLILNNDLELGTDSSVIKFGNDNEVTLTHVADNGLALKHTATADDKPIVLTLQTGETDMQANDVIGAINFQAPDEGTGTDAILVAAGIEAVSEGNFSSSNNATKLSFKTAASEAAAEKMSLSSAGLLTIADDLVIKDGGTIGVSSDADSITIASNGAVTFSQTPVFPDGSIAVADLDIDGATDIGAAIVDADLFIVDDGAGGTNRKVTASRLKTYAAGGDTVLVASGHNDSYSSTVFQVAGCFSATYKNYIAVVKVLNGTSNTNLRFRFLDSSGNERSDAKYDYSHIIHGRVGSSDTTTISHHTNDSNDEVELCSNVNGGDADFGSYFTFHFFDPRRTSANNAHATYLAHVRQHDGVVGSVTGGIAFRQASDQNDGFQIAANSGNITRYYYYVYGLKES